VHREPHAWNEGSAGDGTHRPDPPLGAGAYRQGEGPDLGSVLEFRSGIDLSRTLADGHQITVFLYHLSNASLGRRNPGVEVLGVAYAVSW